MENTLFLLSRVAVKLDKALGRKLKDVGLSAIKVEVLEILSEKDGTTFSEIARRVGRERHDITTLIRRMKRDNLVYTRQNPTDRRSEFITLTENGADKLYKVVEIMINFVAETFAGINEASFRKQLEKLDK